MILLNPDGSCVERGLDAWFFSGHSSEDEFFRHGLGMVTQPDDPALESYVRWYLWNPRAESIIAGPLETPVVDPGSDVVRSKANVWRLLDWGTGGRNRHERDMLRTRYEIRLDFRGVVPRYSGTGYFIGRDEQGIFMWRFIPGSHTVDVPNDVLVYRRTSMEDLRRLVQKGE